MTPGSPRSACSPRRYAGLTARFAAQLEEHRLSAGRVRGADAPGPLPGNRLRMTDLAAPDLPVHQRRHPGGRPDGPRRPGPPRGLPDRPPQLVRGGHRRRPGAARRDPARAPRIIEQWFTGQLDPTQLDAHAGRPAHGPRRRPPVRHRRQHRSRPGRGADAAPTRSTPNTVRRPPAERPAEPAELPAEPRRSAALNGHICLANRDSRASGDQRGGMPARARRARGLTGELRSLALLAGRCDGRRVRGGTHAGRPLVRQQTRTPLAPAPTRRRAGRRTSAPSRVLAASPTSASTTSRRSCPVRPGGGRHREPLGRHAHDPPACSAIGALDQRARPPPRPDRLRPAPRRQRARRPDRPPPARTGGSRLGPAVAPQLGEHLGAPRRPGPTGPAPDPTVPSTRRRCPGSPSPSSAGDRPPALLDRVGVAARPAGPPRPGWPGPAARSRCSPHWAASRSTAASRRRAAGRSPTRISCQVRLFWATAMSRVRPCRVASVSAACAVLGGLVVAARCRSSSAPSTVRAASSPADVARPPRTRPARPGRRAAPAPPRRARRRAGPPRAGPRPAAPDRRRRCAGRRAAGAATAGRCTSRPRNRHQRGSAGGQPQRGERVVAGRVRQRRADVAGHLVEPARPRRAGGRRPGPARYASTRPGDHHARAAAGSPVSSPAAGAPARRRSRGPRRAAGTGTARLPRTLSRPSSTSRSSSGTGSTPPCRPGRPRRRATARPAPPTSGCGTSRAAAAPPARPAASSR